MLKIYTHHLQPEGCFQLEHVALDSAAADLGSVAMDLAEAAMSLGCTTNRCRRMARSREARGCAVRKTKERR
jgi:hypothetical protein